ncbi:DUF4838 domain-containing protein [bacterium]|nr:DUF4838 domain-containing protein [bacterium]
MGINSRHMVFFLRIMTFITVILCLITTPSGAFVLVKDGLPACFIVLRNDAPEAERYAARELTDHLEKMTGARLPIREAGKADAVPEIGHAVLLGRGSWLDLPRFREIGEDMDTLGSQSYFIRAYGADDSETLIITGATPRATLYAVYELLKFLGVRWYTPEVTKIPHTRTVDLKNIDIADFPCFPYRGILRGNDEILPEWTARLRLNAGYGFTERELGCAPEYLTLDIPLGTCFSTVDFEQHPEMFPLINGERTFGYDLCCFTSSRAKAAAADTIIARLSKNPSVTHVMLIPDKSGQLCRCSECEKAARTGGNAVDVMLAWLNGVAERVNRSAGQVSMVLVLPDSLDYAPKRNHLSRYTVVRLGDDRYDIRRPFEESVDEKVLTFVRDMRRWAQRTESVFILHPVGNSDYPAAPFPDFTQTFKNTLMYRNEFVQGMFFRFPCSRGVPFADDEMRMWVLSQLLWDSDLNGDDLAREWIKGVYGISWGPMLDYRKHLQKIAQSLEQPLTVRSDPGEYISGEWLSVADRIIQRGFAQSMTDSIAHRYVRKTRLNLWYTRLLIERKKIESSGISPDAKTSGTIAELLKKWETEMKESRYDRVSETETADQFARSLRTLIKPSGPSRNR